MSPFAKIVRHVRIEREMLLGEMAEQLKVSTSYLSQIESGKKPIPFGFADRIADVLKLNANDRKMLSDATSASMADFKISLAASAPASDRILAGELATEFARLTPEAKEALAKLLKGGR